jgi:O-antigen/teichoic acid export membrane protein
VTLAGVSGLVGGALSPPLMARVASGETMLMARAVRIMLAATAAMNLVLALVTPWLLPAIFGQDFRGAVGMALILLVAQIPLTAAAVLSSALQAHGAPLIPTFGEAIALVITVCGLLLLLRPLGGVGAALVSLMAYSASFGFQLVMTHRKTHVAIKTFLVPDRVDLLWARAQVDALSTRFGFGHR